MTLEQLGRTYGAGLLTYSGALDYLITGAEEQNKKPDLKKCKEFLDSMRDAYFYSKSKKQKEKKILDACKAGELAGLTVGNFRF